MLAPAILLAACALDPSKIPLESSSSLCNRYGAALGPDFMNPAILQELTKRGHQSCADPSAIAARTNVGLQLMQTGAQLMQTPVAPTTTCTTTAYGSQATTTCR